MIPVLAAEHVQEPAPLVLSVKATASMLLMPEPALTVVLAKVPALQELSRLNNLF